MYYLRLAAYTESVMSYRGQVYVNKGIAQFARDHGVTERSVSIALGRGQSFDQIAERARMKAGIPKKVILDRKKAGAGVGTGTGAGDVIETGGYISAREMRERKKETLESRVKGAIVDKSGRNGGSTGGKIHGNPRVFTSEDLDDNVPRDPETGETYPQAKIRHEIARANERELIVAQRRGELAPVVQMNRWFSGCILQARDIFLRLGPELRDRLAASTDPAECEQLVLEEVTRGLRAMRVFSSGVKTAEEVAELEEVDGDRSTGGKDSRDGKDRSTEDTG